MQFSYGVSEDDFLKAVRVRCQSARRTRFILLGAFILICAIILATVVSQLSQPTTDEPQSSSSSGKTWIPITVISVGFAVILQFAYYGPRRLRRLYRKNPAMQGRFTVDLTSESIAVDSTAEFTSRSRWNLYEFWREKDNLIVLVLHSTAFVILNIADLTEPQRAELRGILSSALPNK